MSTEENKALVRRWIDGHNRHDPAIVDELIADDYVYHRPDGQDIKGPKMLKELFIAFRPVFPDIHYTIDDMVAEGDKVAVCYTSTATHKGEYMGIAPTGKRVTMKSAFFYRFKGGKMVEAVSYSDSLAMFRQLGVAPPMEQSGG